jgi:hypothetical protein
MFSVAEEEYIDKKIIALADSLGKEEMIRLMTQTTFMPDPNAPNGIRIMKRIEKSYEESKTDFLRRYSRESSFEFEFVKFNLLRTFAKKITIIWYSGIKERPRFLKADEPNENQSHTHEVVDEKDLAQWCSILSSSPIYRKFYAAGMVSISDIPISPHGIIFETEKEKVFIGITWLGFNLGRWESNETSIPRIFYCPKLALFLKDYIDKHQLKDFPRIYTDILSGKNDILNDYMRNDFQ